MVCTDPMGQQADKMILVALLYLYLNYIMG
jgi:hypothetical protein